MKKIFAIPLLVAGLLVPAVFASVVDQSQTNKSGYADWGHGNGQTFVSKIDGILSGLQFLIEDNINPGTVEVYLWQTDDAGKPIEPKLATGYLNKTNITYPTPTWYTVEFDEPYAHSYGERLAFTIFLVTSGTSGWNDYGYVDTDLYTNGFRINYDAPWNPGSFFSSPDSDWAFRTLVIPSPKLLCSMENQANLTLSTVSSEPDAQYILQTRTNLTHGMWSTITTNTGDDTILIWNVPIEFDSQRFFRLNVQKDE